VASPIQDGDEEVTKTVKVWVYAKNEEEALINATHSGEYDPWDTKEDAIGDRQRPGCVYPGEKLWRVTIIKTVTALACPEE